MDHNDGGLVPIIFLSKWVICRFHVNLPECIWPFVSLWSGPGVQGPLHWLPRTPARSHPSGPPLSWFLRFWTDGPAINSTQMPGAHRQSWDWKLKVSYIDIHRTSGSLNGEMQQNNNTPSPHAFESNTKPPGASQNVHCAQCISTLGNL